MRIGIFMLDGPAGNGPSMMPEVARLLAEWGVEVETIYPERQLTDVARVAVEHDLYVLKTSSDLVWSIAGALHTAGARLLNPYPTAARMRDKIIASRILKSAGIPTPDSFVCARPEQLAPLLEDGPLVVKPSRGGNSHGVRTVWDLDELDDAALAGAGPLFAQRYQRPQGLDRRIYCIGGQLFGVERVWPAQTYEEKIGRPFTITADLHDIALRCGRAFGVDLFGLDVIKSDGHWYVVDISCFPGFKGVTDAALRVADYIYTCGRSILKAGRPALEQAVPS